MCSPDRLTPFQSFSTVSSRKQRQRWWIKTWWTRFPPQPLDTLKAAPGSDEIRLRRKAPPTPKAESWGLPQRPPERLFSETQSNEGGGLIVFYQGHDPQDGKINQWGKMKVKCSFIQGALGREKQKRLQAFAVTNQEWGTCRSLW